MGILANEDGQSPVRPDDALRAAVDPRRYLSATGPRMALLGHEDGVFELWMWPLRIARDLRFVVRPTGRAEFHEIRAQAARVAVNELGFELVFVHQEFTLDVSVFADPERRAIVFAIEHESPAPLEVALRFEPDLTPQWPAGLGGAIAAPHEGGTTFDVTEELGRYAAVFGSPDAPVRARAGDHALTREPVDVAIQLPQGSTRGAPRVFVVAGAETTPAELDEAARRGEGEAARGYSRADAVVRAARLLWSETADGWLARLDRLCEHWRSVFWMSGLSPVRDSREALYWARVALEKAWVEVDGLGKHMVAGLAPSGAGARPGFGWFFDGDALTASRALVGVGDFDAARSILRGAASRQRADGKLMHEQVLSARLCNWVEDYPYAFYKAGNTPALVACLDHYVAASGDLDLVRELLPAAQRAIEWCARATNDAGLLANTKAGLAAVEAGPLCGRIEAETYLNGIWLSALAGGIRLGQWLGDTAFAARCTELQARARSGFESFWSAEHGRYGFALLTDGTRCDDRNAYTAHPMSRGHGTPERIRATVDQLNHPELQSGWGARMFATSSSIYDPAHYNTGSVFPYLAGFHAIALFEHGDPMAGWQLFDELVSLHGFSGLGFVPEHLRGDRMVAPERGVPHQIFSSAALIQAFLYGACGIRYEGERRVTVRPAVAVPDVVPSAIHVRVALGGAQLFVSVRRGHPPADQLTILAASDAVDARAVELALEPRLPLGSRVVSVRADADLAFEHDEATGRLRWAPRLVRPGERHEVRVAYRSGPVAWFGDQRTAEGGTSSALRLLSTAHDGRRVRWRVAGPAGLRAELAFAGDDIRSIHGAEIVDLRKATGEAFQRRRLRTPGRFTTPTDLVVTLPAGKGFVEHEIVFELGDAP